MWWSPWIQVTAALLLLMVLTPTFQQNSCESYVRIEFSEYPNISGTVDISSDEQYKYSSFYKNAPELNFDKPVIQYKTTQYPELPPSIFAFQYNGSGAQGPGWYLNMKKGIDRDGASDEGSDDRNSLEYSIICNITNTVGDLFYGVLTILINDVNDNAPKFKQPFYQFNVSEALSSPSEVEGSSRIIATDKDNSRRGAVTYTLSNSEDGSTIPFKLTSPDSGTIQVASKLDYDKMVRNSKEPSYILNLIATDGGDKPQSSSVKVIINITDEDDLVPNYIYPSCWKDIEKGYCINAMYNAIIISNTIQQEGDFLTFLPIPRDSNKPSQTVSILASDGDFLNDPLECAITQTDPVNFTDHFQVTTTQVGNQYRCDIRVVQPIDIALLTSFSNQLKVTLTVTELSYHEYMKSATIFLNVIPQNNFPPVIESNVGRIWENSPLQTRVRTNDLRSILELKVTDNDGVLGNYEVSVLGGPFEVTNSNPAELFLTSSLDYEKESSYELQLVVKDPDFITTATVTVFVENVNDNAPDVPTNILNRTIPEGTYFPREFILNFDARDPDNEGLDYKIANIKEMTFNRSNINNLFNVDGGNLILTGTVNEDEKYIILVNISDRGDPKLSTLVTVYVQVTATGVRPPRFTSSQYNLSVSESIPIDTSVWTIDVEYRDPDQGSLNYSIIQSNPETAFKTEAGSGNQEVLKNFRQLDRERVDQYELIIRVMDLSGNMASATVTVFILDVNDNTPDFTLPSPYQFEITEGAPIGTSVGTVSANDGDAPGTPFSTIRYDFLLPNSNFQINPISGQISSRTVFDYEVQKKYELTVIASDSGSGTNINQRAAAVEVFILDQKDTVPVFVEQEYFFTMREDELGGNFLQRFVGQVSAMDPDTEPDVVYQFATGDFSAFTISGTGQIFTRTKLSYSDGGHVFTVTTRDGANKTETSFTATVTVSVLDINNYVPQITAETSKILLETAAPGSLVVDCDAFDGDPEGTPNSQILFSIESITPVIGKDYFYIQPSNGQLKVAKPLGDINVSQFIIRVRASDRGQDPRSLFDEIDITVTVVKNNAPFFSERGVTLSPINSDETQLGYVAVAIDTDTEVGFKITSYSLIGDSTAMNYFDVVNRVDAGTVTGGRIIFKNEGPQNDPELRTSYNLVVLVTDGGGKTDRQEITVTINRNLQPPIFTELQYTISIPENEALATPLLIVTARDTDRGIWGQLNFNIVGDDTDVREYFNIATNDQNNGGILTLKQSLVSSERDQYNFQVSVTDGGGLAAINTANVTVKIMRNNNPPLFFRETYNVTIDENAAPGTSVVRVSADDIDANSNFNQITYRILKDFDKHSEKYFTMQNFPKGLIVVGNTESLLQTSTDLFLVRVEAEDNGNPPRRGQTLVYVHVVRNLQTPYWVGSITRFIRVPETQSLDSVFLKLTIQDDDNTRPSNYVDCVLIGDSKALAYFKVKNVDYNNGINNCGVSVKLPLFYDNSSTDPYVVSD